MAFSICKIKNISIEIKTLHGQEFQINQIYQIQDGERTSWAEDSNVIDAIADDDFRICDGSDTLIENHNDQIDLLKDRQIDIVKETALPKMIRKSADTSSGIATVLLKIPGATLTDKRYLKAGLGRFDNSTAGDYVKAYYTDEDNILGYGAGTVIRSFVEEETSSEEKGWWLFPGVLMELEGMETTMELLAGLYIKVVAYKANSEDSDTFRLNMYWGKRE